MTFSGGSRPRLRARFATTACACALWCWSASLDATQKIPLESTAWSLTRLSARALEKRQRSPGLTLDEKEHRAYGLAGCNEFSARYRLSRSTIIFERISYTRKKCVDPYLTTVEDAYLAALERVRSWRVEGATLSLRNAAGRSLLTFEHAARARNAKSP